nr:hypothetical protein [uncultured Actinoplanes sp.]
MKTWNAAAYEVLGGAERQVETLAAVTALERRIGQRLPAAVREWYLFGGDRSLASMNCGLITQADDFTSRDVGRFLASGYLLVQTDSQYCCRWVVATHTAEDDPPVHLIDPDDEACTSRSRYAGTFSDYAFTAAWDGVLWNGEMSADFDHPLPAGALDALGTRLTSLPATHGWAMNQECEVVYRFGGPAKVSITVTDSTALWSAIAAPAGATREALATLIGATIEDQTPAAARICHDPRPQRDRH